MELMVSGLSTLIVGLMVAGIVFLAVRSIVKDRKNGKSLCGGNCGAAVLVCAIQKGKARRIRYKTKKKEAEPAYDCGFCLFLFLRTEQTKKQLGDYKLSRVVVRPSQDRQKIIIAGLELDAVIDNRLSARVGPLIDR